MRIATAAKAVGRDPDEQPEPGRAIHQAEHERQHDQGHPQQPRSPGTGARLGSPMHRMRPHQPGVAGRKKDQGDESQDKMPRRARPADQGHQREKETGEPGVLVETPDMEGDPTGGNHLI